MTNTKQAQQLFSVAAPEFTTWARAFLTAKKAEGLAPGTLNVAYAPVLSAFFAFCEGRGVRTIDAIDPGIIREHLLEVAQSHAPSTVHRHYRVIKTWLRWYEEESAADGWRNPIKRVAAPKVPERVLDPANLGDVSTLLQVAGVRDQAILLTLIDTGLRAGELLALDVADFDAIEGTLTVRRGKGGKVRVVPLGTRARRSVRKWLKARPAGGVALFCTAEAGRLTYQGLRSQLLRLADRAGVKAPTLHGLRRAFTLEMLRAGVDLLSLSRILGHSNLGLLARYAKQSVDDLRRVKAKASPADQL